MAAPRSSARRLADTLTLKRPQKVTDKCFTKCVNRPGAKLDSSEMQCTAMCMDRYLDSMAIVSQAWAARAKQQAAAGGMMQ